MRNPDINNLPPNFKIQGTNEYLTDPNGNIYLRGSGGYNKWKQYIRDDVYLTNTPTTDCIPACAVLDPRQRLKRMLYYDPQGNGDEKKSYFAIARNDCKDVHAQDSCMILPTQNPHKRDIVFVSGKSGCGKSTFAAKFANLYRKFWRELTGHDRHVYLFSALDSDPSIDRIMTNRIVLDDNFLDREFKIHDEFSDCLVIFDDIDSILNPKVSKKVKGILHDCLETGRHSNISVIFCSHLPTDYNRTRSILHEATYIVGFDPANNRIFKECLKKYAALGKETVEDICRISSRWVAVHNETPTFVVSETCWARPYEIDSAVIASRKVNAGICCISDLRKPMKSLSLNSTGRFAHSARKPVKSKISKPPLLRQKAKQILKEESTSEASEEEKFEWAKEASEEEETTSSPEELDSQDEKPSTSEASEESEESEDGETN